jgi:Na+-translocating ferredoxin:NAD+ oxidoreductase subunit G
MVDMAKMIVALTIISALAGLAIGKAYEMTKVKIADQSKLAKQEAIKAVFPNCDYTTEIVKGGRVLPDTFWSNGALPDTFWSATENGKPVGYAFEVSERGYSGEIKFMVGVDSMGKILGLSVLAHNETPGLGSRMTEVAFYKYVWYPIGDDEPGKPWFTRQFEGLSSLKSIGINKSLGEWHNADSATRAKLREKNEITAITGSTISTMAVTKTISRDVGGYVRALRSLEGK